MNDQITTLKFKCIRFRSIKLIYVLSNNSCSRRKKLRTVNFSDFRGKNKHSVKYNTEIENAAEKYGSNIGKFVMCPCI